MFEPNFADAVIVGYPAGDSHAGLRRDGRADAVQLGGDLRRLIGNRRQTQADRLAALDAVAVEKREQQRRVFIQRFQRVIKSTAIGR